MRLPLKTFVSILVHLGWVLSFTLACAGATNTAALGLAVTVTASEHSDALILPEIALFVATGQPATPFVPPGKFTAVWEGNVSAELRGSFLFQAELNGTLKLEVNGQTVLDVIGTEIARKTPMSKPVGLNKGPNALRATFT